MQRLDLPWFQRQRLLKAMHSFLMSVKQAVAIAQVHPGCDVGAVNCERVLSLLYGRFVLTQGVKAVGKIGLRHAGVRLEAQSLLVNGHGFALLLFQARRKNSPGKGTVWVACDHSACSSLGLGEASLLEQRLQYL